MERKAVGEKKEHAGSLDPRGNPEVREDLVRTDQQALQGRRVRRVTKEPQGYPERKDHKDPRDPQALPDPWAHRESLGLLVRLVRPAPRGPVVRGVRKEATEDADHPGLMELREFRVFLDPEDRKAREDLVDHRDLKAYQARAAHQGRQELRETKVSLVKLEVMADQEERVTKGRKATQVPLGPQARQADLVQRDRKATEETPVRRVPQDSEVPLANQETKDQSVRPDPQDHRALQGHKVLREVQDQTGRTASRDPQEEEVLQAPGEMTEIRVTPVSRESLGLVDSLDLMVILVIRVTPDPRDPKG